MFRYIRLVVWNIWMTLPKLFSQRFLSKKLIELHSSFLHSNSFDIVSLLSILVEWKHSRCKCVRLSVAQRTNQKQPCSRGWHHQGNQRVLWRHHHLDNNNCQSRRHLQRNWSRYQSPIKHNLFIQRRFLGNLWRHRNRKCFQWFVAMQLQMPLLWRWLCFWPVLWTIRTLSPRMRIQW